MRVDPIRSPLPGEGVVGVSPPLDPTPPTDWHRRLNLHTGRALNDDALTTEQDGRAGRLALLAQALSAGVVDGLSVALEHELVGGPDARTVPMLHLSPGLGITAQGEDVVVLRNVRVALSDVSVYVRSDVVPGAALPPDAVSPGALFARRVGPSLGELRTAAIALPPVFVVVLQAIEGREIGEFDPDDPCEIDPQNFAFEDWQRVDACRLILHEWPTEWLPLPARDEQWRNRIAHAVFEREQQLAPDELMPWQTLGVPVALVACDPDGSPLFVDSAAVVRAGGKPKPRTPLPSNIGSPFVWQARVEQLAEQLAAPENAALEPEELARQLRYLPPVGLLPRAAVDARERVNRFFPASFQVDAAPVPLEQLDLALEASASLLPYDTANADSVAVLVPVPQQWFEPNLLREEEVADEFAQAIVRFAGDRATWLQRREDGRAKAIALAKAIRATDPEFLDPDPQALEVEAVGTNALLPPEEAYGTKTNDDGGLFAEPIEALARALRGGLLTTADMRIVDQKGLEGFIEEMERNLQEADKVIDFGFMRVQADIYRLRQLVLGSAASRLAVSPALASIARAETAPATRAQLEAFVSVLQNVEDKATAKPKTLEAAIEREIAPGPVARGVRASNMMAVARPRPTGAQVAMADVATARPQQEFLAFPPQEKPSAAFVGSRLDLLPQRPPIFIPAPPAAPPTKPPPPPSLPTPIDVVAQPPVAGMAQIRTTSIAERIKSPKAVEARGFCLATRHDVVAELVKLRISLAGLVLTGLAEPAVDPATGRPITTDPVTGQPIRTKTRLLSEYAERPELLEELLRDPDLTVENVGTYFSCGVDITDHTVAVLRVVEGRIAAYRQVIDRCRETLAKLYEHEAKLGQRLHVIERELAEARHDVAVARALLAEETERVDAINRRRDRIVAEHVTFLAYQRRRACDLLHPLPLRALDPGPTESAVPACLAEHHDAPPALDALIDLVRAAPAKWFVHVAALIDRLDRLEALRQALLAARLRAQYYPLVGFSPLTELGRFVTSINQVMGAQLSVLLSYRQTTALVDLSRLVDAGWQPLRDHAREMLSIGDVIDGAHGRSDLARLAASEVENIARVAGCLHAEFCAVLPEIRLEWAERLSQYDAPVDLHDLTALPRWKDIEILDRRAMQSLVDWLHQRADASEPQAVGLMNDVVRVCLLLASHAPVNEIVTGKVAQPATVTPGARIELATIDFSKLRRGMEALLYAGSNVVARAVVEDFVGERVSARVVQAPATQIRLEQGARVQFTRALTLRR